MKYILLLLLFSILFIACEKEEEKDVIELEEETQFDIRGRWKLTSAWMYFDLQALAGGGVYKKKNHFGGGRTESILIDGGSGKVYPLEYIGKNDIWEFRNASLRVYRADASDTLKIYLRQYYPIFSYQTNPETVMKEANGLNNIVSNPDYIPGYVYACCYTKYFYHFLGGYDGGRAIELVINKDGTISLIMASQYAPSYYEGEYNTGWSLNELTFSRI